MARQFYFDHAHVLVLRGLARSRDERIADIAAKAAKEVRYHVERSTDWIVRLGDGTDESHARMQRALDELWPYTGRDVRRGRGGRRARGGGPRARSVVACATSGWRACGGRRRGDARRCPQTDWMHGARGRGGKQGVHTEHLGHLLTEMQFLQRAYPGAQW